MLKDQIAHDSSFQRPTGHAKVASEAVWSSVLCDCAAYCDQHRDQDIAYLKVEAAPQMELNPLELSG